MPAVLIHGVPEIPQIWDPLRSHLHRGDVVALQLPGFGCPRPNGFGATKEEYVVWLVGELERLRTGGPVDVVGHDWGGGFVVRLVSSRPDLVRSWVTDVGALGDGSFEWHKLAKIWQTAGAGEEFFERQLTQTVEERASVLQTLSIPRDVAFAMADAADRTMSECILALYRSAVDVGREWGPEFRNIPAPGLVVVPSEDPFLPAEAANKAAGQAGADLVDLVGLGHWWMLEDTARAAALLEEFWAPL